MTTTHSPKLSTAARLYNLAHDRAMKTIGPDVFRFQNDIVKHALVSTEILNILNTQDEDMPADRMRELMFDMTRYNAQHYLENDHS